MVTRQCWIFLEENTSVFIRKELVTQSCLTLSDPMDYSLPGCSIHGIFQASYWIVLPFPSPGELLNRGMDQTPVSCIADGFLTVWATREAYYRSIHCFIEAFWDLPIGLCVNLSKNLWLAYGRIRKKNSDFIVFGPGNFPGWLAIYRPSSISIWLVLKHHTFPLFSTQIFFSPFLFLHTQPQMTQSERLWLFSPHTSFHRAPWFSGVGKVVATRILVWVSDLCPALCL